MDNTECSDELAIRGTDLAYLIYKVVEVEYIFLVLSKVILGAIPSQIQLVTYANLRLTQRQ